VRAGDGDTLDIPLLITFTVLIPEERITPFRVHVALGVNWSTNPEQWFMVDPFAGIKELVGNIKV